MAIEGRALPRNPFFHHVMFQALAQRARRLAYAADAHGDVPASRKNPDVAFEIWQKLDINLFPIPGHVVTERSHRVAMSQLGAHLAQRVASACGYDAEVR